MVVYRVNLGVTYRLEADSQSEAEEMAYGLASEEYGKEFVRSCWEDTEEVEVN